VQPEDVSCVLPHDVVKSRAWRCFASDQWPTSYASQTGCSFYVTETTLLILLWREAFAYLEVS